MGGPKYRSSSGKQEKHTLGADPEEETTSGSDNRGGTSEDLEGVVRAGQGGASTVGAEGNPVS